MERQLDSKHLSQQPASTHLLSKTALSEVALDLEHVDIVDPEPLHKVVDGPDAGAVFALLVTRCRWIRHLCLSFRKTLQGQKQGENLLDVHCVLAIETLLVLVKVVGQLSVGQQDLSDGEFHRIDALHSVDEIVCLVDNDNVSFHRETQRLAR